MISTILFFSCTCSTCGKHSEIIEIPEKVKSGAAEYIINKTGKDFFDNYIFPDLLNTKKINDLYELHYVFRMIDYDFVNEPILLYSDTLGNIQTNYEIKGIPNIKKNPDLGVFNVDEKKAIEIAEQNNLSKGIRNWEISFRWHSSYQRYVWHIISTKKEIGDLNSEMYKAEGDEIIINPFNGEVLLQREWKIN
jgi:hypothetical protein